jgi:hypothetical protein
MFSTSKLTFSSASGNPIWTFDHLSDFPTNYAYGIPSGTYRLTVLDGNYNQNSQFFTKQKMPWFNLPADPNDQTPNGLSEAQKFIYRFAESPTGLNWGGSISPPYGRDYSYLKPDGTKVKILFAIELLRTEFPQDFCDGGLATPTWYYDDNPTGYPWNVYNKCANAGTSSNLEDSMVWNSGSFTGEFKYAVLL